MREVRKHCLLADCELGQCECDGNLVVCGDECVYLASNAEHCGACGHACESGDDCTLGLCPTDELATGLSEPYAIAVGSTQIYWTDAGSKNSIHAADLDGANPVELASGQNSPRELYVDEAADLLLWSNYGVGTNDAQIAKRDLGTDTNSVLVSTRPQGVYGITVAAGFVYWANQLTPALSKNPLNLADDLSSAGGPVAQA